MSTENEALDKALRAVADANRRAILSVVRSGPISVGDIAQELGLSQQVTSHHLQILRDARLTSSMRAGKRHLFAVETDGLSAVQSFLNEFWPTRLAALKTTVESQKGKGDG